MTRVPSARVYGVPAVVTAFCALMLLPAEPASAHATLKSISPGHRSVQTSMPAVVVLTFDQPVSRRFTVVKVTGPAKFTASSGSPSVAGAVVRQPLKPVPEAGRYQVAFRTVSVDGHVISGSREFVFKPPAEAASTPASSTPASSTPASSAPASSAPVSSTPAASGRPAQESPARRSLVLIVLAGVVIALAAGVAAAVRMGRHDG